MKKALTITLLVALVLTLACTVVSANTTRDNLVKYLVKEAAKYGYDDVQADIERALPTDIDQDQYDNIVAQVEDAEEEIGDTAIDKLTSTQRDNLLSIANVAAKEVGLKVVVNSKDKSVEVINRTTNKPVVSRTYEDGKLVQTGSSNLVFVVLAGVAIIAVAGTVVAKKVRS